MINLFGDWCPLILSATREKEDYELPLFMEWPEWPLSWLPLTRHIWVLVLAL